ncbi:nucleotide-binding protein [Ideonella sp. DXS22W]|uniref:Nucleotide-binding protein n=1 Tax=Pseudaquabacterium inlustre TaxID=2984192 RepID=A0ABU9CKT7_9BURK
MNKAAPATGLPSMFIASSSEGLPVAYDVQEALEYDCHATVWKQGVFEAGHTVMQDLLAALPRHDVALFVFTPDDAVTIRGQSWTAVRDNVVFELGLFIGALGLDRCFHLLPRGENTLRLPSDLAGLLPLDYPTDRPDGNRLAALGPACNKLRRRLRAIADAIPGPSGGHRAGDGDPHRTAPSAPPAPTTNRSLAHLQHYLSIWNGTEMAADRARLRAGIVADHAMAAEDGSRACLARVYHFLDSMADAVLDGALDDTQAQSHFRPAVRSVWPWASQLLAPPNHADEFWDPLPALARLYQSWQ